MLIHLLLYVLLGVVLFVPLHHVLRRLGFFVRPSTYLRPYLPPSQRKPAPEAEAAE